jgi:hypothetical protein
VQVAIVHKLLQAFALHQPVDEGHAGGQDGIKNKPSNGRVDEFVFHFTNIRMRHTLIVIEHERQIPKIEAFRKEREKAGFVLTPIDPKEAREMEAPSVGDGCGSTLQPPGRGDQPISSDGGFEPQGHRGVEELVPPSPTPPDRSW